MSCNVSTSNNLHKWDDTIYGMYTRIKIITGPQASFLSVPINIDSLYALFTRSHVSESTGNEKLRFYGTKLVFKFFIAQEARHAVAT